MFGCCRSRKEVCHRKKSNHSFLPHLFVRMNKAVSTWNICLHLVTPVPLPELCSLAMILLIWVLPWVPLCGYKLLHLPLPDGREKVTRLWESEVSSILSCGNTDATTSAGGYCLCTSVHRPKDCWERWQPCAAGRVCFHTSDRGFLTSLVKCRCWNDCTIASP